MLLKQALDFSVHARCGDFRHVLHHDQVPPRIQPDKFVGVKRTFTPKGIVFRRQLASFLYYVCLRLTFPMFFFSISSILFLEGGSGGSTNTRPTQANRQTGSPGEPVRLRNGQLRCLSKQIHRKCCIKNDTLKIEDVRWMYMCSWNDMNDVCFPCLVSLSHLVTSFSFYAFLCT